MDGTDFATVEYQPFSPGRKSHKFNSAGLRYEVAISIATGLLVHINGPWWCGEYPDIRIARMKLNGLLPAGEYYFADVGYRDANASPAITRHEVPPHERRAFDVLMARHETVNRRFKEWGILQQKFRHDEPSHYHVFRAVAVLVQMDIMDGGVIFPV